MKPYVPSIGAGLVGLALSLTAAGPAHAVNVVAQTPCTYTSGLCLAFNNTTNPIPTVRSYTFNMPAAGKALVRFDGTMQCIVASFVVGMEVIELSGQIVGSNAAVADYKGPGGNRFAMRLDQAAGSFGPAATVNLAASRLFTYTGGGTKTVFYKLAKTRMDPSTFCSVGAAAFTVQTFP